MKSRKRTLELAIYLADSAMRQLRYNLDEPELFCIAVIFLILKFEGDLNYCVADFFQFVISDLKVSTYQVTKIEGEILIALPPEFSQLTPLCEIFSTARGSEFTGQTHHQFARLENAYQEYLDHFIFQGFSRYQFRSMISLSMPPVTQLKTSVKMQEIPFGFGTTLDPRPLLVRSSSPQRLFPSPAIDLKSVRQTKRVKLV